jgi:hypothetical protein
VVTGVASLTNRDRLYKRAVVLAIILALAVELIADPLSDTLSNYSSHLPLILGGVLLLFALYWYRKDKVEI